MNDLYVQMGATASRLEQRPRERSRNSRRGGCVSVAALDPRTLAPWAALPMAVQFHGTSVQVH